MSDNKQIQTGGINFFGLLAIVFITLKLIGYINWSWWWVLSPLWLPFSVLFSAGVFVFIIMVAWAWVTDKK